MPWCASARTATSSAWRSATTAGFDVDTTSRGNGLTNMEDRLDALGGTLHIASTPEHGTTLRAAIPVLHTVPITI
jgi:signal transduction histidine kinase